MKTKLSCKFMLGSIFCFTWIVSDYTLTAKENAAALASIEASVEHYADDPVEKQKDYEMWRARNFPKALALEDLKAKQTTFSNSNTDTALLGFWAFAAVSVISFIGELREKLASKDSLSIKR